MIVAYTAVWFAATVLVGFAIGTCQIDWLYFIGPVGAYALWHLVKAVLREGKRYRGLHMLTAGLTFIGLMFAMFALFQIPSGSWWRFLNYIGVTIVYTWLLCRNRTTYLTRLEIDAKVQEWKDEMRQREEEWQRRDGVSE